MIGNFQKCWGRLKTNDPIIGLRWANGYYCQVEDRHFIILDDAELFDRNTRIDGFAEVLPETLTFENPTKGTKHIKAVEYYRDGGIRRIEFQDGDVDYTDINDMINEMGDIWQKRQP